MAGPLRKLEFDVGRFESHIAQLLQHLPSAHIDLRGDAYGVGCALLSPSLERAGAKNVLLDGGSSPGVAMSGQPNDAVLSGDEVLGYAHDESGFARFSGTVVNVKRVPAGRKVSYGYTYVTKDESTLALVNLGYADGAVRRASNLAPVRIGGETGVIAGRIAMDQCVVDLGDGQARPGDEAVLWGNPANDEPSIHHWSTLTGIPVLALLAAIGPRVARIPRHQLGGDE